MDHGYYLSMQEVEKGALKVQDHLQLNRKVEVNMRHREREREKQKQPPHRDSNGQVYQESE